MPETLVSSTKSFGEALDGLRVAVDRQPRGADFSPEIVGHVTSICRLARKAQMEPERVLVSVKDALQQSTVLLAIDPDLRSEVTSRVISLTIVSYFANG